MVNVILEPQLVLPIFLPNMQQKMSRNGAIDSIVLPTLQKHNNMQPIQHLNMASIYPLYENDTRHARIHETC